MDVRWPPVIGDNRWMGRNWSDCAGVPGAGAGGLQKCRGAGLLGAAVLELCSNLWANLGPFVPIGAMRSR